MSRKAPAVQFYAEDFLGGTRFLSNAEVGLYIRLLCEQIDAGSVPDDVERFVSVYGKECRKLWPKVREKFIAGPSQGTMVNERMVAAIAAREAFRAKQKAKSDLALAARSSVPTGSPTGTSTGDPVGHPLGDGVSITQGRKERATPKPTEGFDEFWAVYPSGKAKADAVKAWGKLRADERALCIPAIVAQVNAKHFRGHDGVDYIPYGSSWLNARRWEDEVTEHKPVLNINGGMTKAEADEEMRQIRIKHGRDPVMGWVGDEECSRALLIYMGRIKERKAS